MINLGWVEILDKEQIRCFTGSLSLARGFQIPILRDSTRDV